MTKYVLLIFLFTIETAFSANYSADNFLAYQTMQCFDPASRSKKVTIQAPTLASSWTLTLPVDDGTAGQCLSTDGSGVTSWASFQSPLSIGNFSSTPTAKGLTLSSNTLNMDPADGTHPGGVSTTTQTFAGAKTFSSTPTFSTMTVGSVLFAGTSGVLSQDNSNFFYNSTNHFLGLQTVTPRAPLEVENLTGTPFADGIIISGTGHSDSNTWNLYNTSSGIFQIMNKLLNSSLIGMNSAGRITIGNASFNHPTATALFKNYVGDTTPPTIAVIATTSQTGAAFEIDDVTETPIASITIAGKGIFSNLRDTALSTGIAHVDSSGDFTSSVVTNAELQNSSTTVNGQTCTLGSTCTVHDASAVTAVSVASANGFAGSSSGGATPALTLTTTVNAPVLAGNGTAIAAATTTGSGSTVVLATAPTMTSPVVGTQSFGDNTTKAASTAFVQTALAQLNPAAAVKAASTANIPGTYTNAVGGVCIADTFQVTSTAAFAPDGVTLTVGQRFLMKDQSSGFQNGVWTLTTAANVGVLGALLTRALDWDTSADMNAGSLIPVISGTANANTVWYQTAAITTCSSDSQIYTQFSGGSGGGCVPPVLTKTTDYTISSGDFTCANKVLIVEANCPSACTMTFPAASNSGYEIDLINIGSAAATAVTAGSDTFGSTIDTSWAMPPGGSPQISNIFKANGGARWNGF